MEINEIEDLYKKNLDLAENKFIADVKAGLDITKVDSEYKKSTERARKTYNSQLGEYLRTHKDSEKKKKSAKDDKKVYKVDTSSYDLSFSQKMRIGFTMFFFKLNFKIKNALSKKTPSSVLYIYYRLKIKVIRIIDIISVPLMAIKNTIADMLFKIKTKIKDFGHTKS